MEKAKIYDYDIANFDALDLQRELDNNQVRFEFDDCYFIIKQNPHHESGLQINKIQKCSPNSDQIVITPHNTNSISIF